MAGFSSEEVQAQITRFLTTQVESTRTKLGLRDTLGMRDAVYDLLTTTLLLRPDSFFYLVWLTSNRLQGFLKQQIVAIEQIQTQIGNLSFRTKPISSTTELVNAQAAVLELNAGLNSRGGQGIQGSIGPAVDRFRRATERFISTELTKNVVRPAGVTETPEEIRASLADSLAEVLGRHAEIVSLSEAVSEAITRYSQIRLPERAVRDIVGRIQSALTELTTMMNGDDALKESREAMLSLLVMRTILTKASGFRAPELLLAPKVSDAQTIALISGSTPGSLLGSVSGPYNYDLLSPPQLRFQVGTPVTQVDITLPEGSNALVRTADIVFPFSFSLSSRLRIRLDGVLQAEVDPADGPHASAADLATALDGLYSGWTVLSEGDQLVFYSNSFADDSSLEFLTETANQLDFTQEVVLETLYGKGRGVSTDRVIEAIYSATPLVLAEEVATDAGAFEGVVEAAFPSVIKVEPITGDNLTLVLGSSIATSASNLERLGAQAGMKLVIYTPPSAAGTHTITSVAGGTLEIDPPAADGGVATFAIGPDLTGLPVGARVDLVGENFRNTGLYRIAAGGEAFITLDRALPAAPDIVSLNVDTSYLSVSAAAAGPSDGIAAFPADDGLTALGFTADVNQAKGLATRADTINSNIDFLTRGVRAGDILRLSQSSTSFPDQTITSVGNQSLTFSPGLDYQALVPFNYQVLSVRYSAWQVLKGLIDLWLADDAKSDVTDLEFHAGRLLRGADRSNQLDILLASYLEGLEESDAALTAYVVPEERSIGNILRMLEEQGMDRALDLLVSLELSEFFSMSRDSVSYSTHLVRSLADTTRQVAPVGKTWKSSIPGEQTRVLVNRPDSFDPNEPTDQQ